MPKIKVRQTHLLDKGVAIHRAWNILSRVQTASPVAVNDCYQESWNGQAYELSFSFLGIKISGKIYVTALEVELYADIPFRWVSLRPQLEEKFQRQMKKIFTAEPDLRTLYF